MTREQGERLFIENLEIIEDVIRFVAARYEMRDADAEDFGSDVKTRLIENDYAVVRSYAGLASFKTYITIVIQRLALDARIHQWGKWHSSAEAKRIGPVAVELEKYIRRDKRTIADALLPCQRLDPDVTLEMLEQLATRLPYKEQRMRLVGIEDAPETRQAPVATPNASVEVVRNDQSRIVVNVIRETLLRFTPEDQKLFRLHFGAGMKISEVARAWNVDKKPLYPRIIRCLQELRKALEAAGISQVEAREIADERAATLDFGLDEESAAVRPSDPEDAPGRDGGGSRDGH